MIKIKQDRYSIVGCWVENIYAAGFRQQLLAFIMQYINNMIIERTRPSIVFVPFPYEVKKAGLDRVIKK